MHDSARWLCGKRSEDSFRTIFRAPHNLLPLARIVDDVRLHPATRVSVRQIEHNDPDSEESRNQGYQARFHVYQRVCRLTQRLSRADKGRAGLLDSLGATKWSQV